VSSRSAGNTRIFIAIAVSTFAIAVPVASGQSGGVGTSPPPTSGGGASETSDATPDPGGKLELNLSNARPRKAYLLGSPAVFRYEVAGTQERDVTVEVVSKSSRAVVARFERPNVAPKVEQQVSWGGRMSAGGMAPQGEYRFRVLSADGAAADTSHADGKPDAGFYAHKFPVRGRHTYGDSIGAGRGHRGQDVFASCGTRMVAAHAGTVQSVGYDGGGGGNYLVIDGKHTKFDYVYMHLQGRAAVREGSKVKTGEYIGKVGDTGNAVGCHLHFELWSAPGWYEGGHFMHSVTRNLKRWDRWS
jgi:murein DD-endopeptidase MepM/ murein hydrolase activator NlpD